MKDCKVNILGTEYSIHILDTKEDKFLEKANGYCDKTSKKIVVAKKDNSCELECFEIFQKKVLRHEIIHAFLLESGLSDNFEHKQLGQEETVVDWIAIQFPKMLEVFKQSDCL